MLPWSNHNIAMDIRYAHFTPPDPTRQNYFAVSHRQCELGISEYKIISIPPMRKWPAPPCEWDVHGATVSAAESLPLWRTAVDSGSRPVQNDMTHVMSEPHITSISFRKRTRATRCLTRIVLYTEVDVWRDKLSKVVGRTSTFASSVKFVRPTTVARLPVTLSTHLCQNNYKLTTRCCDRRAVAKFSKSTQSRR